MKMKIGIYIIELNEITRSSYDLRREVVRTNKKTGEKREAIEVIAYGIHLSRAIDMIANELLEKKEIEDVKIYVAKKLVLIQNLYDQFEKYSKEILVVEAYKNKPKKP